MDPEWDWEMTPEEEAYVEKIQKKHDFHDVAETLIKIDRDGYAVVDGLTEVEVKYAETMMRECIHQMPKDFNTHSQHPVKYKINHSPASWYIRTRPSIREFFEKSTQTKDLVVSFAGIRYWDGSPAEKSWGNRGYHTDQGIFDKGRHGTCGYVALTDNEFSGFAIIKGSHRKHNEIAMHRAMKTKRYGSSWNNSCHADFSFKENSIAVVLKKGQMLLYDSRLTFSMKQSEEMIMGQYVSYFERSECTKDDLEKRLNAFHNQWTSTNMPFPFKKVRTSSDHCTETINYLGIEGIEKLV